MDNVEKVENTEKDDNTNSIQDLVKASLASDYNHANKVFGEVMTIKMSDLLDQEKIRMADQVYNGVEPEKEDVPEDEDLNDEAENEDEEDDAEPEDEDEAEDEAEAETEEEDDEVEGAAV